MTSATGNAFTAVLNAAEAARLVRESYPNAKTLTFGPGGSRYQRPTLLFDLHDSTGVTIWSYSDEHSDQLARQQDIRERLADAYNADPECPLLVWGRYGFALDIDAALDVGAAVLADL